MMKSTVLLSTALLAAVFASGCGRPFNVNTPPGFVDFGDRYGSTEYRAATADGVVLGVRAFDNDPKGESAFWLRAIENRMRDMGGYALLDKHDVKNRAGEPGTELKFGHDEGNQPSLYVVAVYVSPTKVFVLEAGGAKDQVERLMPQIDWSIRNFVPR
jgi:hypothetical protein